ncbi:hypothetical protein HMPREF2533_00587 [Bacteroides fragilis]|nr:hypothetical protein HMPREF2530_00587 [Bacteroides fragilis]KXU49992.1 hypothetical protein HMPREF2533_00587 [Bacteroides fragilis]
MSLRYRYAVIETTERHRLDDEKSSSRSQFLMDEMLLYSF